MEIKHKSFQFIGAKAVVKEVRVGWFRPRLENRTVYEAMTFEEFLQQVQEFVNGIGRDRIQNICEYSESLVRYGDDGATTIVVWYWDDCADQRIEAIS